MLPRTFTPDTNSSLSTAEQRSLFKGGGRARAGLMAKVLANFNKTTGAYEGVITTNNVVDTISVGAQADLAGSGVALTAARTYAAKVCTDDGGASIGDSVSGLRSRTLLTVAQSGGSIRALQGQLKILTGKTVATGIYTASQGYVELVGTLGVSSGATFSCFDASMELGGVLTVASGGEAFGIHVETTGAGTIVNNGTCAAVGITKASGAASWPVGLQIPVGGVLQGLRIGDFTTGAATTAAIPFAATQDFYTDYQLDTIAVHGASNANLTSLYSAKVARFRHVVNCTTAAHETYGAVGQLVVRDTTLTHLHAGIMGTLEGHTSGVVVNSAYTYGAGAIIGRVGGGAYITGTTGVSGIIAFWNGAALASGSSSAFAACDSGTVAWTNALAVARATNLFAVPAAGTAPVATGGASTGVHGGTVVKIACTVGGAAYFILASTAPTFT